MDKEGFKVLKVERVTLGCGRRIQSDGLFSQENGGIKGRNSLRFSNYSIHRRR